MVRISRIYEVRPTRFDKKFSVIRAVTSKTSTGGTKKASDSVLYTDWCNKKPVTGAKRLDYTALNYSDPYILTIRKRLDYDITETDIIRFGSTDYQIKSIIETEDQMYQVLEVAK